jgi:uncharacterized protein (DUF302 family)
MICVCLFARRLIPGLEIFYMSLFICGENHSKSLCRYHSIWREPMTNGLVEVSSPYSVAETVARLESVLAARGIPVLARIDHSGGAAAVGLTMPPTQLIVFGNAKAGTPLMLAAPTVGIDLPLKVLVREDVAGKVWVSYNSAEYIGQRHGVPEELQKNIAGIAGLVAETVKA